MGKEIEAHDEKLGKSKTLDLSEIGDPGPIEKVTYSDFIKDEIKLEAFMNEILTVIIHQDTGENAVENPCPGVNGVMQPFIRGIKQKVRRKYVEALACGRKTAYIQNTLDPTRPDNIQMVPRNSLVYPFSVLHDPNPMGGEWLNNLLAQP